MRFSYKKVRLALFTLSYPGRFIRKWVLSEDNINVRGKISRIARVLYFDVNSLTYFIYYDRNPKKLLNQQLKLNGNDKEQILTYLKIEEEISILILERDEKESLVFEDYGRRLLEPAIERVAGTCLSDIEDDIVFEVRLDELKKRYQKVYYTVAYKYKLPTLRILPFIIRLIS